MAMSYSSLVGSKSIPGSISGWVSYSRLDLPTIVDESQALLYSLLRVREMRASTFFNMGIGSTWTPLPARFLDPIGKIFMPSFNTWISHKDLGFVRTARNYAETSGTLGSNPVTTTSSSTLVSIALTGHGFNQGSAFNMAGAAAVGGVTPNGTFEIVAVTDANNFVVDLISQTATSGATGGGTTIAYLCDNLTQGTPLWWSIWDERIQFDSAFNQAANCQLFYYQSLPLLATTTNETNFLTNRYPHLMRKACQAAAADFMQDDAEYQKTVTALQGLVGQIQYEADLELRGAELYAETP